MANINGITPAEYDPSYQYNPETGMDATNPAIKPHAQAQWMPATDSGGLSPGEPGYEPPTEAHWAIPNDARERGTKEQYEQDKNWYARDSGWYKSFGRTFWEGAAMWAAASVGGAALSNSWAVASASAGGTGTGAVATGGGVGAGATSLPTAAGVPGAVATTPGIGTIATGVGAANGVLPDGGENMPFNGEDGAGGAGNFVGGISDLPYDGEGGVAQGLEEWAAQNGEEGKSLWEQAKKYGPAAAQELWKQIKEGKGLADLLGSAFSSNRNEQTSSDLRSMYEPYNQGGQAMMGRLQDSYSNPGGYLDSPDFKAIQNTVHDQLMARDSTLGKLGNSTGRQKMLQDNAFNSLNTYRQGLSSSMTSLAGIGTGQGAFNATQSRNSDYAPLLSTLSNISDPNSALQNKVTK